MTLVQKVIGHAMEQKEVMEVAMAFPRGSRNYGLYREGVSDIDFIVLFLPHENDLYVRPPMKDRYVETGEFEYKLVDIRNILKILKTANLTALDFIWSEPDEWLTAVLGGFSKLDMKMFHALEWIISYNLKSFYLSHIGQTKKALHEYREKGYNYKTSKRLITATYLLWSLNVFHQYNLTMESTDLMVLMHSAGKWDEYPSSFGSMGDMVRLKFDLGEDAFVEFVERVEELLVHCEDQTKYIPQNGAIAVENTLKEVENVLVDALKDFYSEVDNNK